MKNVLKIQELERQIRKLKSSTGNSPENAKYEQIKSARKQVFNNMNSIDNTAAMIVKQFEQVMARFEQLNAKSEITAKQKPEKTGIANIGNVIEDANYLTSELAKLEQKLRNLNDKANRLSGEFTAAMNEFKVLTAKQEQIRKIVDQKQASIMPEVAEKEAEIKKLEASVDKAMYEKYKNLRNDNIFPVFVRLNDNRCGACRLEQSLNFIQKLKQAGMLPCEQCRRIILSDD